MMVWAVQHNPELKQALALVRARATRETIDDASPRSTPTHPPAPRAVEPEEWEPNSWAEIEQL